MKLILPEPESEALEAELLQWNEQVTSAISITEVVRSCASSMSRLGAAADAERVVQLAWDYLAMLPMLDTDIPLLRDAAGVSPIHVRSLDAVHLSSALSLGQDLGALFTYDRRLADAALSHGLPVRSPS